MFKIRLAKRLNKVIRFIQYWSAQQEQPNVHPTVTVETGSRILSDVLIGRYTYIGHNTMISSGSIGAFCSISWNVTIGADEHPLSGVSKHPFWYSPIHHNLKASAWRWSQEKAPPVIGNDVWIGAGATVLRGAVIEDGAVIGAGSIVTGHVPAYAVVGGIPAKRIKYLIEDETIRSAVRATKWWDWDEDKLVKASGCFGDIKEFVRQYGLQHHIAEERNSSDFPLSKSIII